MIENEYIATLENVVKQMITPLRDTPLKLAIEALSGHRIVPFNETSAEDRQLLKDLITVAKRAGQTINPNGLRGR